MGAAALTGGPETVRDSARDTVRDTARDTVRGMVRGMVRGGALAALLALAPAGAARAQDWVVNRYDDGSFFQGTLAPTGGPGFSVVCGERSARGLSPQQTGNMEPDITRPNAFRLFLSPEDVGFPAAEAGLSRDDVLVVIGTTGYRFAYWTWNELYGSWETDLPADDPVFAAIAGQAAFELRFDGGAQQVASRGFASGLEELRGYCRAMFAAVGRFWAGAAPAGPGPSMADLARRRIAAGCGAGVRDQAGAIQTGEIDGDGHPDAVLDWRAVRCAGGIERPYCGASQCSAEVFLSSVTPLRGAPEDFLGLSLRLIPLSNGAMGLGLGGGWGDCERRFGRGDCEFQYYWNGRDLVPLNF